MADSTQSFPGGGCFSKLVFLILLVAAGGLGAAIIAAVQPQDLTDLSDPALNAKAAPVRDMKAVLKSSIDRGYPLTLQQTEINQWLARTLRTRQGGFLKEKVTFDRVWIRLEEGQVEIVMERHFLGKPFTVSMFCQVERLEGPQGEFTEIQMHGGPYHPDFPKPPRGGRFGNLVIPQGFLILVMPAYKKLAELFPEEIELALREMSRITLEKGQIVLDPREQLGQQGMPQTY